MTKIKFNDTTVEIPKDNSTELVELDGRVTTNENNIATNTQDIEDIKSSTTIGMNALELVNGDDFDTLEFKSQPSNTTLARLAFEHENFDITGTSPEYEVKFIGSGGGINDVDWGSVPLTLPSYMSHGEGFNGFAIRNNMLFVNLNTVRSQNAIAINSNTLIATVPDVELYTMTRIDSTMEAGDDRISGYMEIHQNGDIRFRNYDAIPAQTGAAYNTFYGYFNVPLRPV